MRISIGSVDLRIESANAALCAAAAERYAAFRVAHPQSKPYLMRVIDETATAGWPDGAAQFVHEFEGARVLAGANESCLRGARSEYKLDSLLRILLTWKLLECRGFLLHAATVVRDGRAYVFTGRSGAGKSTIASLSPEGSVLTDEISLLRYECGEWRAYGTPFWGEFRAAGCNSSAPLAGIFRIVQSAENRVTPLRPVELLRALLPNVLFFSEAAEASGRLLDITGAASREVPGYTLAFRKDTSFWEILPR